MNEALPSSYSAAVSEKSNKYFTGKPCKRGHVEYRYVNGGCAECIRQDLRKGYAKDPAKHLAKSKEYHAANRDRINAIQSGYRERSGHLIKARAKNQRGARALRVPSWSQTEAIAEFYKQCPPGCEVDHYYPLQGETVSGLHVIENLQYLTMADNRAKHNKVPE